MKYELWEGVVDSNIKTFTDLNAWKFGHEAVVEIYKITRGFPKEEVFGLTSQLRRCAVSITSNLAEGFSRATYKDKAQFYSIALGSVTELQNQLMIARDVGYLNNDEYLEIDQKIILVHKLTNGLIKGAKAHNS